MIYLMRGRVRNQNLKVSGLVALNLLLVALLGCEACWPASNSTNGGGEVKNAKKETESVKKNADDKVRITGKGEVDSCYLDRGVVSIGDGNKLMFYSIEGEKLWEHSTEHINSVAYGEIGNGLLWIKDGGDCKYFDATTGDIKLGTNYCFCSDFKNEMAIVCERRITNERCGIVGVHGEVIVPFEYAEIPEIIKNGTFWAKKKQEDFEYCLYGKEGKRIGEDCYEYIDEYSERNWIVMKRNLETGDEKQAIVDAKGRRVSGWYDFIGEYSDELSMVEKSGHYGFIDENGKNVLDFRYYGARNFSEGLAAVKNKEGKWGFINKKGELEIGYKYNRVHSDFFNGYAVVSNMSWRDLDLAEEKEQNEEERLAFIKKGGDLLTPYKFTQIGRFSEGLAAVEVEEGEKKLKGFIGTDGETEINPQYEDVLSCEVGDLFLGGFSGGITMVKANGRNYIVDKKGKCLVNC